MVINEMSCVRLSIRKFGESQTKGFGIVAAVDLKEGEVIYELAGMIAADSNVETTELSMITMEAEAPNKVGPSHVLFGPLRFINHKCKDFNSEVSCLKSTKSVVNLVWLQYIAPGPDKYGVTICIVKDIKAGEELFTDYGPGYFDPDPCPCAACVPLLPTSSSSPPKQEINAEEQHLAKNANKRAKRQRKKEAKKM